MNTKLISYIESLKLIQPFEKEIQELSEIYYKQNVSKDFYSEFWKLKEKIIQWLYKEYPRETNDKNLFRDDGRNNPMPWGIDYNSPHMFGLNAFIACETRPAPHGGYPGAQWAYDTSDEGRFTKVVPVLVKAYQICKDKGDEKRQANEKIRLEQEKWREQKRKQREQEKIKRQKYKNTLINSLHITSVPAQNTTMKSMQVPIEWRIVFNYNECDKLYNIYSKSVADKIYTEAWEECKEKREKMLSEFHAMKKNEMDKDRKALNDDREAFLLEKTALETAKQLLLAQQQELATLKLAYEQELLFLQQTKSTP